MVGEGVENIAGRQQGIDGFVGQDLVDGRTPEVAVGEVGGFVAVELEGDLAVLVREEGIDERRAAGCAVGVDRAADPAVEEVVGLIDRFW